MTNREIIDTLDLWDIYAMCEETSKDAVFEAIRALCGKKANVELIDFFDKFVDANQIFEKVYDIVTCSLSEPENTLQKIYSVIATYIEVSTTEHYFIMEYNYVRRIHKYDLERLKLSIMARLSLDAEPEVLQPPEEVWVEEDDDFLTKENEK